ncbi:inactive ubiquitin carboxyl-terminal hydrolase 53-like isoform X2 [Saccostrea cucullata]|uniref:inactive ubiquitin carboxyl-terminal hydrolase 53-like isoform X2 n=1 Tax=Saccostrea cuccullata TaxID=36930 RepID=UPI002ED14DE3
MTLRLLMCNTIFSSIMESICLCPRQSASARDQREDNILRVFWHLDVFRRSYRRLSGHLCMGNSCIFCALKVIFTQFQYSDQASLPPDALRRALADSFTNQQRFQLGHMDDAAECFENILRRIHFHVANAYHEDSCSAPHCLSHQKFTMTIFDQLVCVCGASSEPLRFHETVHYITTNALVSQYRSMQETGDLIHNDRFGLLLRNGCAQGDIRDCPDNCGKRVQIRKTLLNSPDVVSIGLVWDSERPETSTITDVCRCIGTTILLQDLFHSVMCKDVTKLPRLQLSAVVCYYGKHYSTFVYDTKSSIWKYFDDATVTEIGPKWEHVVDKCSRGRYQPLLLLYTNPNASPISTDTAPKKRVMAPGFGTPTKGVTEKESRPEGGKQSRSKSSSIVSQTSDQINPNNPRVHNPDQYSPDADGPKQPSSEHRRQPSFLIAITGKNGKKVNSEYAIPVSNAPIKQPLPGGQVKSEQAYHPDNRSVSQRGFVQHEVIEEDQVDGYTLSNSDQYRRPALNAPEGNSKYSALNFNRVSEVQRKESLKKGKGKVGVDVIRYQIDPQRSSSDSDSQGYSDTGASTPPSLPPKRLTHSQSYEESPANLSADHIDVRQHVVMKPKPNAAQAHNYENIDNLIHTPVQSGLATLPRNKKGARPSAGNHSRQGSMTGDNSRQYSASHSRQSSTNTLTESCHSRQSSSNTLTEHSRQNSMVSEHSDMHSMTSSGQISEASSRQSSTVSQHSDIISQVNSNHIYQMSSAQYQRQKSAPVIMSNTQNVKPGEPLKKEKPPKPAKPEKKPGVLKKKNNVPQQDQHGPPLPDKKKSLSPDSNEYIDRKMVESVLKYQTKLSRQGSTNSNMSQTSQSSNTSFESDNSSIKNSSETQFDNLSLESHRDSGYGSSDRNSSSSTGSSTLDPYTQYFLNKSMIPPKTFNPQAVAENMRKFIDPNYQEPQTVMSQYEHHHNYSANNNGPSNGPKGGVYMNHPATSEKGKPFHPVVDGFGNPIDQSRQLYDPAIVRSHQGKDMNTHPNYNYDGHYGHSGNHPSSGNSSYHPLEKGQAKGLEGDQASLSEFTSIYQASEDLMDHCVLAETNGNFQEAIRHCSQAIECLKKAIKIPNLPSQSYTYGQKKHNSCLLKVRSLQKKAAMMRQESNSSSTSSDSARSSPLIVNSKNYVEDGYNRNPAGKPSDLCINQNVAMLQQTAIHSRSSSRDSVDSVIENKNYRGERPSSGSSTNSQKHVTCNSSQNSRSSSSDRTLKSNSNSLDVYGTLPRKGKANNKTQTSNQTRSVSESRNTRSVTPTPLDSSSTDSESQYQMQMPAKAQIVTNVAEIRPLHNNSGPMRAVHSQPNMYLHYSTTTSRPPTSVPEVCSSPAAQQMTAKTQPVLPPKPNQVTEKTTSAFPPPKKEGSVGPYQKTMTYKADCANVAWKDVTSSEQQSLQGHYSKEAVPLCSTGSAPTPHGSTTEGSSEGNEARPSVRDLASRFDGVTVNNNHTANSHPISHPPNPPPPQGLAIRHRSKSESDFRNMQEEHPKSVLSKKKKSRGSKPRKSVTFCDNIALISAADLDEFGFVRNPEEFHAGYVSDEEDRLGGFSRSAFSDNDLEEGDSSDSPVEIYLGEDPCNLCSKRGVVPGHTLCAKCQLYMRQFQTQT